MPLPLARQRHPVRVSRNPFIYVLARMAADLAILQTEIFLGIWDRPNIDLSGSELDKWRANSKQSDMISIGG